MILGYASEIEDTVSLSENTRKQAEMLRRQSENQVYQSGAEKIN